jgi:antitoxin HicB
MVQHPKHCTKNGTLKHGTNKRKIYQVVFYRSASGREPVRQWLKQLDPVIGRWVGWKNMNKENRHIGSSLDEYLAEEGLLETSQSFAIKQVLAWQIAQFIEQQGLTKADMASRMNTSRSALDRLLDPDNDSVTLKTLQNAASTIGAHLEMKLVFNKEAA